MGTTFLSHSAVAISARVFESAGTEALRGFFDQGGMVELYAEIAYFAEVSAQIALNACLNKLEFPSCYAYDVDETFGDYLAEVFKTGYYKKETAEEMLYSIAEEFFLQMEINHGLVDFLMPRNCVINTQQVSEASETNASWNVVCRYEESLNFMDVYQSEPWFAYNVHKLFAVDSAQSLQFDTIKSMKVAALERLQTLGWPSYESYYAGLQYTQELNAKVERNTILVA